MNPILYEATETEFKSNGLGRLSECVHCLVTEERNGIYECEFQYPITGKHYADIQDGRIISVTHDDRKDRQPFVIYRRSAPINGIVTFNAHHISYGMSDIIVEPFTASAVATALSGLKTNSLNTNPFSFWTDNAAAGSFELKVPTSVRSALGGVRGSILDVFGGEYEFDQWQVKLYAQRGCANGVTIRYGKNLTDITYEADILGLYDAIVPYWTDGTQVVYGAVNIGTSGWDNHKVIARDFSSDFNEAPTVTQLNTRATSFLANNKPWIPNANIAVNFVALWQTEEYKNIAPLERVRLCDTVKVIYTELGVEATAKVIKTVWNPLLDRYDSLELGEAKTSFADIIAKEATDSATAEVPTTSMMQKAIDHATDLITGGLGGNIVIQYDGNGKPTEILAMDTDDVSTAVHVLRINVNGIGFSSRGIEGPYTSAWTLDGKFVADFITAGHMKFNLLQGGILTLGGNDDGNGTLVLNDASGNRIVTMNNNGLTINKGSINIGSGVFKVTDTGKLTATDATITGVIKSTYSGRRAELNVANLTFYNTLYDQTKIIEMTGTLQSGAVSGMKFYNGTYYMIGGVSNGVGSIDFTTSRLDLYHPSQIRVNGTLAVTGAKPRLVNTKDYGNRYLYCYETPSPLFGDVGEGEIAEDGKCYVWKDSVFAETITLNQYQVFLQKYGKGDCWVSEKTSAYFVVEGTPGMKFGWEIKAKQADFDQIRLDKDISDFGNKNSIDYAENLITHIAQIKQEREVNAA